MHLRLIQYLSPVVAFKNLKNIFNEKRCPACQKIHPGKGLCKVCLSLIKERPKNLCIICGEELNSPDAGELPCITCQTIPRNFSRLYFYGVHEGLLREMILGWKFNNRYCFNSPFQKFIAQTCREIETENLPDLIIPVPLHTSRLRERGFNQSLILAQGANRTTGAALSTKALLRTRKTIPQTELSGAERRKNLHTAFHAVPALVAGRKILLVDDVYTTGSTVDECSRALLESGAKQVEVMTLARALI